MQTKTVLVIEDNDLNMEIAVAALELCDCQVLQAADAETGIQLARAHTPDLILMDVQLPGMDGFTATAVIKADPATQHIPVVAVTAYAMQKDRDEALKAGCSGFISKPFSLKPFMDTVKSFLNHGCHESL